MYTLSAGIWEKFFKKKDYYVVIVGLDNAGKTVSLLNLRSHRLISEIIDFRRFWSKQNLTL